MSIVSISALELGLSLPLGVKIVDALFPEAEILIELTGPEYEMERVPLFWLWKKEQGSKLKVSIKGKPGFCQAAASHLVSAANRGTIETPDNLAATLATVPSDPGSSTLSWSRFWDFFRTENSLTIEASGSDHMKAGSIFWEEEKGMSFHLKVRGKPGFCTAMSGYLKGNVPEILNFFYGTESPSLKSDPRSGAQLLRGAKG